MIAQCKAIQWTCYTSWRRIEHKFDLKWQLNAMDHFLLVRMGGTMKIEG